ncbi:VENN motif pre-toxin domain-containing protein [Gallibacterium salpingitidis]|uniref:VENN motif pre-toxin domain-containing protein n=1 Tax=Gallibacterium salpingitidis TaxID=505341 RepID=UPI000824FD30|nr:VENN motif pre-toxin domain-containing protein [Gallibacterium salpingitidis]
MEEVKARQEMAQVIGDIANNGITLVLKPKLDEAERQKAEAEAILKEDKTNAAALEQKRLANDVIKEYGQGGKIQLAVRAVTGVLQGIATGDASQAAVGGLSPYINHQIKEATTDKDGNVNLEANLMAHALLGAIEAYATGNNAAAGAAGAVSGELAAKLITEQLYQKSPEQLTEAQKQTVSALSQLASGLAGGLISDSTAGAINSAEIGKRAVENNYFNLDKILSDSYYVQQLEEKANGEQLQNEITEEVHKKIEVEHPVIYGALESLYNTGVAVGKGMYISRELAPWVIGIGEISSSTKIAYYATKYPYLTEGLIAGTVSTGFDIYNDKFTPEGAMMNYVLSGITVGKSLSKQLSINTIYQGIVSANDNTKNDKEVFEDIAKKNLGVAAGYSSSLLANKIGLYGIKAVLSSTIIGTYIENVDTNYSNLNSKDKK